MEINFFKGRNMFKMRQHKNKSIFVVATLLALSILQTPNSRKHSNTDRHPAASPSANANASGAANASKVASSASGPQGQASQQQHQSPESLLSAARAGLYTLTEGTDDCPTTLEWKDSPECEGFTLIPQSTRDNRQRHQQQEHELFCHINKPAKGTPPKTTDHGSHRMRTQVTWEDTIIHRTITTTYNYRKEQSVLRDEDSIFIDTPEKFLWDANRNGGMSGSSCLYSK
jgi:hypothetical protein